VRQFDGKEVQKMFAISLITPMPVSGGGGGGGGPR
jgi:hypothetical protein